MNGPNYLIREYPLQQGALEIAYIEEYFSEFPERKTAAEIMQRLDGRECHGEGGSPSRLWKSCGRFVDHLCTSCRR